MYQQWITRLSIHLLILAGLLSLQPAFGRQQLPDFTELVEKTAPAVVSINTSTFAQSGSEQESQEELPEFFRRFFDIPENGGQDNNRRFRPERRSGGSGFLIDAEGYLLTNHHVVDGAEEIIVTLSDQREFEAKLIGSDELSDIALLKIEGSNLPALKVGDSNVLKLGEWVLAIGSPFGFEQSVTAGIVSAKGRSNGSQQYVPFIQTDVPINRGNSGGPLLNMDGEVVGVNSWILSSNGGFIGLSFAIPIETAARSADQLRRFGRVQRGLLGVGIQPVDRAMAEYLNMDRPVGALINRVNPDSAADKAGLQEGDVITVFNGEPIEDFSDLPPLVGSVTPGERASLVINREGKRRTLNVVLGALDDAQIVPASLNSDQSDNTNVLGLKVTGIGDNLRDRLQDFDGGVVVSEVESEEAWRAGVRPGDVLVSINRKKVESVSDFESLSGEVEQGEPVALLLLQNGNPNFIAYIPEDSQG